MHQLRRRLEAREVIHSRHSPRFHSPRQATRKGGDAYRRRKIAKFAAYEPGFTQDGEGVGFVVEEVKIVGEGDGRGAAPDRGRSSESAGFDVAGPFPVGPI
jgi:hypothetical protein